jgi:hypothetical protein
MASKWQEKYDSGKQVGVKKRYFQVTEDRRGNLLESSKEAQQYAVVTCLNPQRKLNSICV